MPITQDYAQHLKRKSLQENSIASYLSDLQLFMKWKETNAPLAPFSIEMVKQYLKTASFTRSAETMKRKEVSLTNFVKWINDDEKNSNIYTNNSIGKYGKYLTGLALTIVCIQIALSPQHKSANDIVFSENISIAPAHTNFEDVNIPIAVSGYEIETDDVSSPTSVVLSLHDDALSVDTLNAGKAYIPKGDTFTLIVSDSIKDNSIITVTPTSPTGGQTLYIHSQQDGVAVIAIESSTDHDISFNWNVVQYLTSEIQN